MSSAAPTPEHDSLPVTSVCLGSRPNPLLAYKGQGWEGSEKPLGLPPTSPWSHICELGCSHLVNVSWSFQPAALLQPDAVCVFERLNSLPLIKCLVGRKKKVSQRGGCRRVPCGPPALWGCGQL